METMSREEVVRYLEDEAKRIGGGIKINVLDVDEKGDIVDADGDLMNAHGAPIPVQRGWMVSETPAHLTRWRERCQREYEHRQELKQNAVGDLNAGVSSFPRSTVPYSSGARDKA